MHDNDAPVKFTIHDEQSAPEGSRPLLEQARATWGMIPNQFAVLAESPVAFRAYRTVYDLFTEQSALSPQERHLVLLTISRENGCHYCTAGHSMTAKMANLPDQAIAAICDGTPPEDARLAALYHFTVAVVRERGHVSKEVCTKLLDVGYTRQQLLDVLAAVMAKTLSNYVNHIAGTPLEPHMSQAPCSLSKEE